MSESFYASCAEVLALCQSMKDDLAAILDPETGFAPRLRDLCKEQIAEEEDGDADKETLDALRLEQNTWGLLQAIMPARKTESSPSPSARTLLVENPYTPTSTLAQAIMNSSPLLTELVVVREWLHETAPPPQHPEATTGYWKFTKHTIMQALRTGGSTGVVKQMDPDAVNRGDGKTLAADDAGHEKILMQALYAYIRAGRLEDAVELCRNAHQPWRSASIRGTLLFQWKSIANEQYEEDAMEQDDYALQGNARRRQWKQACMRVALNPDIPDAERVLYAALAPSPQTYSILKSACRTWEDHLWAQLSVVCEEKQTAEMIKLGGGFWEGGLDAVDRGVNSEVENEEAEEEEWEKEVVGTLETLAEVRVEDGLPADHAFHYSQLNIILDRTTFLLEMYASGLQDGSYLPSSPDYANMCRFFAHLCLYLQLIDIPVPPLATQVILEAYIQVLEGAGQRDLIAMYAGALGENAVERYAMFLTSLELSADLAERKLALTRAREHNLDVERVAIVTAERTIEKAFEVLPPLHGPLPSIIKLQHPPTDFETLLLRSIEWTTFSASTYSTALEQANVILRYFLATGRVRLAQTLLNMLPAELSSIEEPEEQAIEFLEYRQFFAIWESFEHVVDCAGREVPGMSRDEKSAWIHEYSALVDKTNELTLKLLTSEWLVTDVEAPGGDRRRRELIRVRQIYIPELVIRLHFTLYNAYRTIPGNLKSVFSLANLVADSRYKLYEDFVNQNGKRLIDYLGAVRSAVLGGLEGGGSDVFRAVVV